MIRNIYRYFFFILENDKSASILGTDNCSSTTSAIRGTTTWPTGYYDDSATNASTRFVLSIILEFFLNSANSVNRIND